MQNGTAEAFVYESKVVMILKDIIVVYFIFSLMDVKYTVVFIIFIDISISINYLTCNGNDNFCEVNRSIFMTISFNYCRNLRMHEGD